MIRPLETHNTVSGASAQKRCRTCKTELPLLAFARHNGSQDGYRQHCRECLRTGRRQPTRETEEQRTQRKRRQSRKKWQRSHLEALARHQARFPKAAAATRAVQAGIKAGRITPAKECQAIDCTVSGRLEAHHNDYTRPLEVLFVCPAHHRRGHSTGYIAVKPGLPPHLGNIPLREDEIGAIPGETNRPTVRLTSVAGASR
jgi:hypothetical protein